MAGMAVLDEEFASSVNSLSQELQILGVDDDIQTASPYIACQSLLRIAWNLVQFIHCDSVARLEEGLPHERECKLRDELQQTQTELQQYKISMHDKEHAMKSQERIIRLLRLDLERCQNDKDELRLKVKSMEIKLENGREVHKKETFVQAVECDKLRDCLRSKIGLARVMNAHADSFAEDIERLSISKNTKRTQDDRLYAAQQAILKLTENNQTLVAENLWMRDTFARLYKQLDDIRTEGLAVLRRLEILDIPTQPDETEYPDSVFDQPLSVAIEKLRSLGKAQIDAIMGILRLITKSISAN